MVNIKMEPVITSLVVFFLECIRYGGHGFPVYSDTCDHTIRDTTLEPRGVRQVLASCNQGHIDWRYPYGAVRVTFQLGTHTTDIEVCIKAQTHFAVAKISLEDDNSDNSKLLRTLVKLNSSHPFTEREICWQSSGASTLYIESENNLNATTIGHIAIEYDLQRTFKSKFIFDELEECRPCTDQELLNAVCSNDFVATGTIEKVLHNEEAKETEIRVHATRVSRQTQAIFKRSAPTPSLALHNPYSPGTHHMTQHPDEAVRGAIVAPHKCGVHHGTGEFLFVGRIRLGRALLQCAPRLEDFRSMWRRAEQEGNNPCTLD